MQILESTNDQQIKHFIKLKKKSYRKEHQAFIAEGTRTITTLLEKFDPQQVFMTIEMYDAADRPTIDESKITIITKNLVAKMSSAKTPSGIFAIFSIPQTSKLPTTGPGIILAQLSDPGNMGTIMRTAAAMNINNVICIEGVDPYHPKVIQATTGAVAYIDLYQCNWQQLTQAQLPLAALVVKDGIAPDQAQLKNNFLVLGNEANGLTEEQINTCQQKITLPMPGKTESLNAGIAGAIALYLMAQQN